jgi:tetratricopeptide (TPR) repeat protein
MGRAISSLEQVIRLSPKDHKPHYMWATILLESERFSDALAEFRMAAKLAPPETAMADEIRAAWGNCLIRLRRYEEALEVMKPADDMAEIQALRSQSLFSLRRFEESRACAQDSIRQQPEQIEAALILAQLYDRSGEQQQGITLLRRLLPKHSAELRLHQRLGELLAATGQMEESLIHRNLAGEIAELRRQFSDAHQQAAVDPDNAELRLKLAQLAEKLGKTDLAQGWYQAAVGLSPGNKTIQEQWQQFQTRHFQSSLSAPRNSLQPNASYNEPPPAEF